MSQREKLIYVCTNLLCPGNNIKIPSYLHKNYAENHFAYWFVFCQHNTVMSAVHCRSCHMQVYQLHAKLSNTDDANGEHHKLRVENAVHDQTIFFCG